jgi:hypothetical protein
MPRLEDYAELRALAIFARKNKTNVTLYGSLASKLISQLDVPKGCSKGLTIFDLILPFSDIDLIVENFDIKIRLREALCKSFPIGRFFRWEVRTVAEYSKYVEGTLFKIDDN